MLGPVLGVDGDADAAVEAGVRAGRVGSGSWCQCLPIGTYC